MAQEITDTLNLTASKCIKKTKRFLPNRHKSNNKIWFDNECTKIKIKVKKTANLLKHKPHDNSIREELFTLKKQLKNTTKRKKRCYKENILDQLNCSKKNSKIFWKLLDKLEPKQNDDLFKKGISGQRWVNHFKSIFTSDTAQPLPDNPRENGPLDYPISEDEFNNASYILKPGKAVGIDGISNEMISCLLEYDPKILLNFFNVIISECDPINCWNTSIINPIHKKGSKIDPENYRGISLLCCLGKYFSAILNQRLMKYAVENKIFSKEQLGFIPGNRTSDALIILHNVVDYYCVKNNKPIYACFVDFKKAFDSVPRHKIFEKLLKHNITGKFYDCIKNMYSNDLTCVKVGDKITDSFQTNQGVRQGCILSPTLFNIFLADLPNKLQENSDVTPQPIEAEDVQNIIWADDLLLISKSEDGLNKMLSNLCQYTVENGIEINLEKTKCMVFNKTGRLFRKSFIFGNRRIDTVKDYKYLGFLITPSLNLTSSLTDLKDRAMRAYYLLKTKLGPLFRKHLLTTLHLFDSLIKPILLYSSDYWGCLKLPKKNPIETFLLKFLKELLGVQKQTTNLGVLLEVGMLPLSIYGKKNCIKNWERIAIRQKANPLLLTSYKWALKNNVGWANSVKSYLSQTGLMNIFVNKDETKTANLTVFHREKDIFHQTSFHEIQCNSSKMKTYAKLKTKICLEPYLLSIQNTDDRIQLSKFRLSNHRLMIETGRHNNVNSNNRYCPFCPTVIENEFHFLIKCPTYSILRHRLLEDIKYIIQDFRPPPEDYIFNFLMKCPKIVHLTAKFINQATKKREELMKHS